MAPPNLAEAVSQVKNPSSTAAQITALRLLKNEAIGHAETKHALVKHGIVDAIADCLTNALKSSGKKKTKDFNVNGSSTAPKSSLSDDDEARLQAVILSGSLAYGGAEFAAPMVAGDLPGLLIRSALPSDNPPKIVSAALQSLNNIAKAQNEAAFELSSEIAESTGKELSRQTQSTEAVQVYTEILSQTASSPTFQRQVVLACQLLKRTVTTEDQRNVLVLGGILDLLGARLAAYYISQQFWSPGAVRSARAALPAPPSRQDLASILEATTAIICKSRYRVARLLYSPIVASIMPLNVSDVASDAPLQLSYPANRNLAHPFNTVDAHLPRMPHSGARDPFSKQFPALGSAAHNSVKYAALMDFPESAVHTPDKNGTPNASQSTMISWLIYLIRNERGLVRLQAARLFTMIARNGFFSQSKSRMLALLVVPILAAMLDDAPNTTGNAVTTTPAEAERLVIQEQAPKVLAEFIHDTPLLQKAAVDCGADKKAFAMLKRTFQLTLGTQPSLWNPHPSADDPKDIPATQLLGPKGIRSDVQHVMKCREANLILLAAICEKEDKYRQPLTESGVVTAIIDSLSVTNEHQKQVLSDPSVNIENLDASYGNTIPVVLAACSAARSLSRSITLLRTSLIDNGLVAPIFNLLRYNDINVLVAATDVVCNLVMEFSPMRDELIKFGIASRLCNYAHSADSRVRLVSLWALKHLVYKASNEIRLAALQDLGTGWLLQIITGAGQTSKGAKSPAISMSTANSIGQRVDILNAAEDEAMDDSNSNNVFADAPSVSHSPLKDTLIPQVFSHIPELIPLATQHQPRLREIKVMEDSTPAQKAARDQLQIQVQGLDFIRNTLQGPTMHEMVEKLFVLLGSEPIFEIINEKIQPLSPVTSPISFGHLPKEVQEPVFSQPPEIIISALFILVHLCAGAPRHRVMVVTQRAILNSVFACLHHPNGEVKIPALLSLTNLTWIDDSDDIQRVKDCCRVLRSMGFIEVLQRRSDDAVLNVRERADTARHLLLAGERGVRSGVDGNSGSSSNNNGGSPGATGQQASSQGPLSSGGGSGLGSTSAGSGSGPSSAFVSSRR